MIGADATLSVLRDLFGGGEDGTAGYPTSSASRSNIDINMEALEGAGRKRHIAQQQAGISAMTDGILQNQVRTTEYSILEDTFARRTFDESGDYAVRDFESTWIPGLIVALI